MLARTEWSTPGTIQMPRIGYEQNQLVSLGLASYGDSSQQGERRANPLYRADLLPQAHQAAKSVVLL